VILQYREQIIVHFQNKDMIHKEALAKYLILVSLSLLSYSSHDAQQSIHLSNKGDFVSLNADIIENEGLHSMAVNKIEILEYNDCNITQLANNSHIIEERRSIDFLLEASQRSNSNANSESTISLIANKYFKIKDYSNAQDYYNQLSDDFINNDKNVESKFKLGYTYLTDIKFEQAETIFSEVSKNKSYYKDNATYYLGICQYYLGNKEDAIASFEVIENHKQYGRIVPYYLAQIHFQNQDYNNVIQYAEKKLKDPNEKNKNQINRILGLSYLAMSDYGKALPYLEAYAADTPKLTENEFYQIAILNYNLGNKEKATEYFKELSYQDSEIGQMSNYLLGSIYIDLLKKKDAQSAFKQASKLGYRKDVAEESDFLYVKLSADLQQERIAINGLSSIDSESKYFAEAQDILSNVLTNTEDYNLAQEIIEALPYKSASIQNAYKEIAFSNGLKELENRNYGEAINNFDKAITTKGDNKITNQSHYWKAYTYNQQENNKAFYKSISDYLESNDKEYLFESYYMIAYSDIKATDYDGAISNLESAINQFNYEDDDKNLFDDAIVRLADLQLVNNNYSEAMEYYDLAIENDATESDYILYQKAMIQGVNNQHIDKLTNLEKLLKDYPNSEYRDDALFQIAESLVAVQKNNEAYQIYNRVIIDFGEKSSLTATSYLRQGLLSYNSGDMYTALDAYKNGMEISKSELEKRQALIAIEEIYINELKDSKSYFVYTEQQGGIKLSDITKDSLSFETGISNYNNGEYEKAISKLENYINQYPDGMYIDKAHYHIGDAYAMLKKYSNALPYYENVMKNKSSSYYEAALKNAALITYNHDQNFEKSYIYYDQLLSDVNDNDVSYLEAALYSAFVSNNNDGVLKYGEKVLSNNSISTSVKSSAYYYLAKTHLSNKNDDAAIPNLRKVVELSTNNQAAESSYLIAEILYNKDSKNEAEVQAFNTTKTGAAYPYWVAKSIVLIGDIYVDKNDNLNASAAYESVIENFKENTELVEIAENKLEALSKTIESNSRVLESDDSSSNQIEFVPTQTLD